MIVAGLGWRALFTSSSSGLQNGADSLCNFSTNAPLTVAESQPPATLSEDVTLKRTSVNASTEAALERAILEQAKTHPQESFVAGIVADCLNRPVPDARVKCYSPHLRDIQQSVADKDGIFIFSKLENSETSVSVEASHPDYLTTVTEGIAWGEKVVIVSLTIADSCELEVVEEGTSLPIASLNVICYPAATSSSFDRRRRHLEALENGNYLLTGLDRSDNILVVLPTDRALLPNFPMHFGAIKYQEAPLRIEIERLAPITIAVLRNSGSALSGAQVRVYDQPDPPINGQLWDPWRPDNWLVGGFPSEIPRLWAEAETDLTGTALCHRRKTAEKFGAIVLYGGKPICSRSLHVSSNAVQPLLITIE